MGERLRRIAARHPRRALGVLAAVAVLGTALAAGWTERLTLTSSESKGALRIQVRGGLPAGSPTFRVAVQTMRAQLSAYPAVAGVGERRPMEGGNSTLLLVGFDAGGSRRDATIARIERNLDPGPLELSFKGPAATLTTAKDAVLDDLALLLPALALIALIAAATLGVRLAFATLLAAAAASALAALACEALGGPLDVSWLALVGAVSAGTLISLQLCAMARSGARPAAIAGAGLAAAAAFAAVAALDVDYLAALGLGGALGSLLAVPASLTAIGSATGDEALPEPGAPSAPWRLIGDLLGWSRAIAAAVALLALALLLSMAVPSQRLAPAALGAARPPAIDPTEVGVAIGAAGALTALAAWALGSRAILAISSTVAFALPPLAVAGLLAVSFQERWLEGALDYQSTEIVHVGSLVGAVAIVAAVSAAGVIALVAASRQAEDRQGADRVAEAMARSGPAAALVCLAGAAAGIALVFSSRTFVKEFGLGAAAGLLLQLVVVQPLIVPALLRFAPTKSGDQ